MKDILIQNKVRIFFIAAAIIGLVLVRLFENELFYDPFLNFFKIDFQTLPLPIYNSFDLFIGLLYRYFLNAILSLIIIYLCFKDREIVKFATLLYIIFFVVLTIYLYYLLSLNASQNNLSIFYVRRFLIQPIFVLLFIPGFYYQIKTTKN